jgi:uncharacterized protein
VGRRDRIATYLVSLLAVAAFCLALSPAVASASPIAAETSSPDTAATLAGNGSVDEAWLTGASPGDQITLMQNGSAVVVAGNPGIADSLGSLIVRNLAPGPGYSWKDTTTNQQTTSFPVFAPGQNPAENSALYTGQAMQQGLNYITMRDGIQLAATVRFPYGETCSASAPCPTVLEYSGYGTAGPTDPIPFYIAQAFKTTCGDCGNSNLLPDSATGVGSVLARTVGFATVSLQMRGTGCSGGAFDLFGYPSDYDAYDAIEIVAHQAWVAHHKVGMVGISYSGLSQLPAAGTDPPDLAAIAPMSPTDDLFSTGYPGGIYNDGFAASWISERIDDAMAAASYSDGHLILLSTSPVANVGQPWTYYEIDAEMTGSAGDSSTCLNNQALHSQAEGLESLVGPQIVAPSTGSGRDPALFDRRSMVDWASSIKVPVFLSGALQDEQTGPQWPALIDAFPKTTPLFVNMVNGNHIDSTDPQIISRWLEFLDIYVADEIPTQPTALGSVFLDEFASAASGISTTAPLPALRFTQAPNLEAAQADFATNTPFVQVLFDNGAGSVGAGHIESTYSASFASWPPAGQISTLYFGANGLLRPTDPAVHSNTSFSLDPAARPATSLSPGGNTWAADPTWDWTPVPTADGVAFQTPPFQASTTIVGPATLKLWVRSAAPVEDYQATITEVRPTADQEEYVTSGFVRSSNQVDNRDSNALFTDPTYLGAQSRDLSPTRYTLVKIPLDPIAHTFRAGTVLRVVLSAPGGDRPIWEFDTIDNGQQATVGLGGWTPSALVVNEVSGVTATAALPACNSLRGEPCRAYTPLPGAPVVTTQPTNQSVPAGGTVTFTAAAKGAPTPTVAWEISVDGGNTWIDVPGLTSSTFSGQPTAFLNHWQFRAVFTNDEGAAATSPATLAVT